LHLYFDLFPPPFLRRIAFRLDLNFPLLLFPSLSLRRGLEWSDSVFKLLVWFGFLLSGTSCAPCIESLAHVCFLILISFFFFLSSFITQKFQKMPGLSIPSLLPLLFLFACSLFAD